MISGQTDSYLFSMEEQMLMIYIFKDQKIDYRSKRNCTFFPRPVPFQLHFQNVEHSGLEQRWIYAAGFLPSGSHSFPLPLTCHFQTLRSHRGGRVCAWVANSDRNGFQGVGQQKSYALMR